ncbi:ribosomal protein S12p Asp88 methylthiotransferase [Cutibacterium acnes JCM 18909]|nr:ribosomal protein S12p Asp88 methylthiotransferase [Cutibacterium acnes JCM 18909]
MRTSRFWLTFLQRARLDVAGIFAYSDEEGTEAAGLDGHVDEDVITARREDLADLTDELVSQRAEDRIGTRGRVMVEEIDEAVIGRAEHQGWKSMVASPWSTQPQ